MKTIKRLKWAFLGIMIQIPVTIWIVSADFTFKNFLIPAASAIAIISMLKANKANAIIKKTEKKEEFIYYVINILVVYLTILQPITIFKSVAIVRICLGGFLIIFGNILPRAPRSTSGFLPFAVKSEKIWRKTYKLFGFLTVLVGIILVLFGFFNIISSKYIVIILYSPVILFVEIYSYFLWKKEKKLDLRSL